MEGKIQKHQNNDIFNTLNANLDNTIQLRTNASYRDLQTFLKPFNNKEGDKENTNIIDQGMKVSYAIPEKVLPRFFKSLEQCRLEGLALNFSEKQIDPSGLMLDFDIKQENEKSQLDDSHFYTMVRIVLEVFSGMVETKDTSFKTWAVALRKPKTVYLPEDKCFKDGFHLIFPGVKMAKDTKKYLIKQLLEKGYVQSTFDEVRFLGNINDILDKNSAHVVTLFPGSCKAGKIPYEVYRIYKIHIKESKCASLIQHNLHEVENVNLVYDFSVNYTRENGLLEKREFPINAETIAAITQWSARPTSIEAKVDDNLSILSMHDPDSAQLKRIIDILAPSRCDEYKDWFAITCAIGYMGDRYRPLAYHFGCKREKGIRVEFDKVWGDAVINRNKYSYSKQMIYNYARTDNPEEYKIIMSEGVFAKLTESVFDKKIGGYVDHWNIAQILKEMVGGKFVVDVDKAGNTNWYEFILEDDQHIPGEVYKWRKIRDPFTLRNYISTKLPIVFDRALEYLDTRMNASDEKSKTDYYSNLIKILRQSSRKLYNSGFKSGVIREAETLFRQMNFARKMDQDCDDIMGVANGVLLLGKAPQLIQSYHPYKISRFSTVKYIKIDPDNPIVREVYLSIWDLFPEGEKDVFHYILFFFCTSLTARMKACLFLTLRGNGANGKSYFMELIRCLLNGVDDNGYGYKMPIQYLIERERTSNSATPVLMPLKWARFTFFSESDKSEELRVAKKKTLTSQEPLNGRMNYGDTENFVHRSNFVLTTNYALSIDTTDHGTWRRERYYTMKMKFCQDPTHGSRYERKADPRFAETKARDPEFLSGFLSILTMYFGIMEMQYGGDIRKVPCPTIDRETEIFRNSQDVINRFITQRVVVTVDEDHETKFTELVDEYCRWYDANIKERRHDRLDVSLMFKNSRLTNSVEKQANGTLRLKGMRVLGAGEDKNDDEYFVGQDINAVVHMNDADAVIEDGEVPDSDRVLKSMHTHYLGLLKEHNVEYW